MPTGGTSTRIADNLVLLSLKGKTKGRMMRRKVVSTLFPAGPKCFGCQGFRHMKHECPTYLKSIGKSKALVAILSDTETEEDSDNEVDGILNVFTTTVNPTDRIVEDVDE